MPPERGRIRTLSRGTLAAAWSAHGPRAASRGGGRPRRAVESLDPDASRWLSATLATRRDRGRQ
jgi:hypothetical protein